MVNLFKMLACEEGLSFNKKRKGKTHTNQTLDVYFILFYFFNKNVSSS